MNTHTNSLTTNPGDLVEIVSPSNKFFLVRLQQGKELHTHRGILKFDDLIHIPWGSEVQSHSGSKFYLVRPSLNDILKETRRNTQIMYPKDIGYILIKMNIGIGAKVIEAGTGSGSLTTALAWAVGETGQVYTYEVRPQIQNLALKNLKHLGLENRVTMKLQDIQNGFEEKNVDAIFLDVTNPYDYLVQVRDSLQPGGHFGCILPTATQVITMLHALEKRDYKFVNVLEIMLRNYRPIPDRFRPTDRMVAHTGYLIFARPIITLPNQLDKTAVAS